MSESAADSPEDTPRDEPYTTTDAQRRRNTLTLLVIMGLLGAMIAAAIVLPNLNTQ